jgi:hypothetical protein
LDDLQNRCDKAHSDAQHQSDKCIMMYSEVEIELSDLIAWVEHQTPCMDDLAALTANLFSRYHTYEKEKEAILRGKISSEWNNLFMEFKALFKNSNCDAKGMNLEKLRLAASHYKAQREALSIGERALIEPLLAEFDAFLRNSYNSHVKELKKFCHQANWLKASSSSCSSMNNGMSFLDDPSCTNLKNSFVVCFILAQIAAISPIEVTDLLVEPILKKFRFYFSNGVALPSQETSRDNPIGYVNSNWIFIFGLDWFMDHQFEFIRRDLNLLAPRVTLTNNGALPLVDFYLTSIASLFSSLCQLNVQEKSDWIVAEYLVDALKFDYLFNLQFFGEDANASSNARLQVFEKMLNDNPVYLERWIKVEKYKALSYLHEEIFKKNPFELANKEFLPQNSTHAASSRPPDKFIARQLGDGRGGGLIALPFQCADLFINFLDEFIEEELGFLLLPTTTPHSPLLSTISKTFQENVLNPFIGFFLDFLSSSMKDNQMDLSFLLNALMTLDFIKLSRHLKHFLTTHMKSLDQQCEEHLASLYFASFFIPLIDDYKMTK